ARDASPRDSNSQGRGSIPRAEPRVARPPINCVHGEPVGYASGGGLVQREALPMATGDPMVRRTLHLKFKLPSADPAQLLSMTKVAAPFMELFGSKRIRILQNVDDPASFIQEIEYETHEALELNRQRLASDPRMQTYLQTWRMLVPGAVELDVYQEMSDGGARRARDSAKPRKPRNA